MFGSHARERFRQRSCTADGCIRAILTATSCKLNDRERWELHGGKDQDGDDLTVVCVLDVDDGVIVVTVF